MRAQGADGRADRVFPGSAAGNIGVGAVEGKVSLVQFADGVPILPEDLPARFHIGFGFFDFTLRQQGIDRDPCGVHLGAEIERRRVSIGVWGGCLWRKQAGVGGEDAPTSSG